MRMTQAFVNDYYARQGRQHESQGGVDKESGIHAQILDECKRRGWIAFHGSMARKTFRTPGEPDFILFADRGRVFAIEAKTARGKLSPEQLAIKAWSEKLGHTVHVVRSFAEFLEIVDAK